MKQQFEFFQDFIDAVHDDKLDKNAEQITFSGGWASLASQNYEGELSPSQVLGKVLRFQLVNRVPVISRRDSESDGTCKRPPLLPLEVIQPGLIYSLRHLGDMIRVAETNYMTWYQERRRFGEYLERLREGTPYFAVFFKERQNCGFDEGPSKMLIKGALLDEGYLFNSGQDHVNGIDSLLIQLWRRFMKEKFPHYK